MPEKKQKFIHMVPLIEIIANHYDIKTMKSKQITKIYEQIIELLGSESEMWFLNKSLIEEKLDKKIDSELIEKIIQIKNGNFSFSPIGFDGTYGRLVIGQKEDIFKINYCSKKITQKTLI